MTVEDALLDVLLPKYYKRLFPHYLMCKWLGYSEGILSLYIIYLKCALFYSIFKFRKNFFIGENSVLLLKMTFICVT